jgi:aspartate-semialdehyde dehydrogenase
MRVLIVGTNGMVGRDLVRLFHEDEKKYHLTFCNSDNFMEMLLKLEQFNVIFNCSNDEISKVLYNKMSDKSVYIDNSSYLRQNEKVPLVVPEINFVASNVYANPNCVTIILTLFLNSIKSLRPVKINVSTYQSLSGAGREKFKRFLSDTKETLKDLDEVIPLASYKYNKFGFNFYPHESKKNSYGYSGEEEKIMFETKKIIDMDVFPTCIRVPAVRCHGESVNVTFKRDDLSKKIFLELFDKNGIKYDDKIDCLSNEFNEEVSVGHLRQNKYDKREWSFFVVGDQLTRGASYNAFKIFNK